MTGEVTAFREAVMHIEVRGSDNRTMQLQGVVDTGFTDFLTLPTDVILTLGLPYRRSTDVELGDGSIVSTDVFDAWVMWDGLFRRVQAQAAETVPLIGMSLLLGYHLAIDVVDGGAVTITPLL